MSEGQIKLDPLPTEGGSAEALCLDGGSFIADVEKLHADRGNGQFRLYNWAFHIKDQETGRHVLWDLGMTSDYSCYASGAVPALESVDAVGPREAVVGQLSRHGISSDVIESVLFSHAHWDHCRPIANEFPSSISAFGPGTFEFCAPGHLADLSSIWDGRIFDPKRKTENTVELKGPWVRFGPFDRAMDYFGTGSLWIIQAPGHMPGNLAAAVKVLDGQWILLGSDGCHTRDLLDGLCDFGTWKLPDGSTACLQMDKAAARDTIARYKLFENHYGAHIVLAHDTLWMQDEGNVTLQTLLDDRMKSALERIRSDEPV